MATIGSLGVGSGLDLNGLLDKIASAERAPLNAIRERQTATNARISAYGSLKGLLSTLQAAADKLGKPDFLSSYKAASSAPAVLKVSAGSMAASGTYNVNVTRLAQSQSLVADGVATPDEPIGTTAATITIGFGAITGTFDATTGTYEAGVTFAPDAARAAVTVSLEAGKTSLQDVRDAINRAGAGAVTASIINDGTNHRLVLSSSTTGANSAMEISVAGNAELQGLIGHDLESAQGMRQSVEARNAALTVNGIAVTSASNSVQEAMQGVSMTLLDVGTSTVNLERDDEAVQTAISDFVSAYNRINAKIRELTAFNADKKAGAVLLGDGTTRVIQSRLRDALFEAVPGVMAADPGLLSDIGISAEKDGSLKLDSAALTAMLAGKGEGVAYLLAGNEQAQGLARTFSSMIGTLIEDKAGQDEDGLLTVSVDSAKKGLTRLAEDYARASDRIDAKLDIIRAQFRQLDSVMSSMTSTSNYLTTQFANLSRQTSK